jgi:hypothetical protein
MESQRLRQAGVPARDELQETAQKSFDNFSRTLQKISPKAQIALLEELLSETESPEGLTLLEKLLDGIPTAARVEEPTVQPSQPKEWLPQFTDPQMYQQPIPERDSLASRVERIIEECDRPWAMTSESLYGMFPADWDKEAKATPDFVVNSTSEELANKLAKSIGEDPNAADFIAACESILSLQNKPMSSPWFETGGGRLRSEITYTLSPKGQTFVRFLRTVKESSGSEKSQALSKMAAKTLEKIDLVMEK